MRSAVIAGLAVSVVSGAVAAPRLKDQPSVVGEWVYEHDRLTERYVFTADGEYSYVVAGDPQPSKCAYMADPKKSPAEIDLKRSDRQIVRGIYKVEGDTLTACFGSPGADRPTKFERSEAPYVVLLVLKRTKTKD
jgi:uncharacterized protein (TIGR03067 family)